MTKIFHPLLALIASATDKELAKYVEYLRHENKLLRARLPKQVHTTHEERQTLLKYVTWLNSISANTQRVTLQRNMVPFLVRT